MKIPVIVYEDVTGSGLNYFDTLYENSPVKIIGDRIYLITTVNQGANTL